MRPRSVCRRMPVPPRPPPHAGRAPAARPPSRLRPRSLPHRDPRRTRSRRARVRHGREFERAEARALEFADELHSRPVADRGRRARAAASGARRLRPARGWPRRWVVASTRRRRPRAGAAPPRQRPPTASMIDPVRSRSRAGAVRSRLACTRRRLRRRSPPPPARRPDGSAPNRAGPARRAPGRCR